MTELGNINSEWQQYEFVEHQVSCLAKFGTSKQEVPGTVVLTTYRFVFFEENVAERGLVESSILKNGEFVLEGNANDSEGVYWGSLREFRAHRQHPRLPMVQIRFDAVSKNDSSSAAVVEQRRKFGTNGVTSDVTLVFKDAETGSPDFPLLQQFIGSLSQTIAGLRQRCLVASATAAGQPTVAPVCYDASKTIEGKRDGAVSQTESEMSGRMRSVHPQAEGSNVYDFLLPAAKQLQDGLLETEIQQDQEVKARENFLSMKEAEKELLLQQNAELRECYKYLVEDGRFLTAEQFWAEHQAELAVFNSFPAGLMSNQLFLSKPVMVNQTSDGKAEVSDYELQQIIAENPTVQEKYDDLVPHRMTESEFWSRFFQSKYYFQLIGASPPEGADETVIRDFESYDQMTKLPSTVEVQQCVDPEVDLLAMEGLRKPGFGTVMGYAAFSGEMSQQNRSGGGPNTAQKRNRSVLFNRFNRHSTVVLRQLRSTAVAFQRNSAGNRKTNATLNNDTPDFFKKRRKILEGCIALDDLQSRPLKHVSPLDATDAYQGDLAAVDALVAATSNSWAGKTNIASVLRSPMGIIQGMVGSRSRMGYDTVMQFVTELQNWKPTPVSGQNAEVASSMFILNTKLLRGSTQSKDMKRR